MDVAKVKFVMDELADERLSFTTLAKRMRLTFRITRAKATTNLINILKDLQKREMIEKGRGRRYQLLPSKEPFNVQYIPEVMLPSSGSPTKEQRANSEQSVSTYADTSGSASALEVASCTSDAVEFSETEATDVIMAEIIDDDQPSTSARCYTMSNQVAVVNNAIREKDLAVTSAYPLSFFRSSDSAEEDLQPKNSALRQYIPEIRLYYPGSQPKEQSISTNSDTLRSASAPEVASYTPDAIQFSETEATNVIDGIFEDVLPSTSTRAAAAVVNNAISVQDPALTFADALPLIPSTNSAEEDLQPNNLAFRQYISENKLHSPGCPPKELRTKNEHIVSADSNTLGSASAPEAASYKPEFSEIEATNVIDDIFEDVPPSTSARVHTMTTKKTVENKAKGDKDLSVPCAYALPLIQSTNSAEMDLHPTKPAFIQYNPEIKLRFPGSSPKEQNVSTNSDTLGSASAPELAFRTPDAIQFSETEATNVVMAAIIDDDHPSTSARTYTMANKEAVVNKDSALTFAYVLPLIQSTNSAEEDLHPNKPVFIQYNPEIKLLFPGSPPKDQRAKSKQVVSTNSDTLGRSSAPEAQSRMANAFKFSETEATNIIDDIFEDDQPSTSARAAAAVVNNALSDKDPAQTFVYVLPLIRSTNSAEVDLHPNKPAFIQYNPEIQLHSPGSSPKDQTAKSKLVVSTNSDTLESSSAPEAASYKSDAFKFSETEATDVVVAEIVDDDQPSTSARAHTMTTKKAVENKTISDKDFAGASAYALPLIQSIHSAEEVLHPNKVGFTPYITEIVSEAPGSPPKKKRKINDLIASTNNNALESALEPNCISEVEESRPGLSYEIYSILFQTLVHVILLTCVITIVILKLSN